MKNHINIKCPGCRKSFKAGFSEIEFMNVHECPKCSYKFTREEKAELYNAVYTLMRNHFKKYWSNNQNSHYA